MAKREELHAQLSLIQLPVDSGVCKALQLCRPARPPSLPLLCALDRLPSPSALPNTWGPTFLPCRGFVVMCQMCQQPQFGGRPLLMDDGRTDGREGVLHFDSLRRAHAHRHAQAYT